MTNKDEAYIVEKLDNALTEARICAGALFERYALDCNYDRALIAQMIRDNLKNYIIAVGNLTIERRIDND